MNKYFKVLFFVLTFVYSLYDVLCVSPEPRARLPFKSGGDASLSFIAGELKPAAPTSSGTRDFVAPDFPSQNNKDFSLLRPTNNQNIQNQNVNPQPNIPKPLNIPATNIRDYVAPALPLKSSQTQTTSNLNPSTPTNSNQNLPKTGSNSRDYVNPNYKPGEPFPALKPINTQTGVTQNVATTTKAPGRDFVNPNINPTQKPISTQIPEIQKPIPQNSGSRDFVNPNFNPQKPRDPFPALKPIAPNPAPATKDPFPALKTPGSPSLPQPGPGLSYAQKAAGGVTTVRPRVSVASRAGSATGSTSPSTGPSDSTTKAPDNGPKDDELREFSEDLLKKDVNNAFKYVKLNLQGKTNSQSKNDEAPQNLLEISKEAFNIPTIAKLRLLYNNYILEVTENEFVTPQEKTEENDLLDALLVTPIMQHTRNFLISKGKLSKDPKEFKDLLRTTWFSMYSRGSGRVGSSGFEHIFLAELKKAKNEVSGLHNWLYFHEAEQTNLANYLGYMKKIDLGEKGAIVKFHFSLSGTDKPVSSIFVGTSPELEMALYTTCYVFRANRICPLRLNGHNFIVRSYSQKYRGKYLMGSAFPEI